MLKRREQSKVARRHPAGATIAIGLVFGLGVLPVNVPAGSPEDVDAVGLTGFTTPVRAVTLAPVQTGRIVELKADEGVLVQAGEIAFQLDADVQAQRVAITRALASSELEVDIARVRWEQAQRELARLRELGEHAASAKEVSDAEAEAEATALLLEQALFERAQALREYALQQALLNERCIRAPFTGYVSERLKEVGETVEEREGVLTLVQLDPLVVVFDCPLETARQLEVGQRLSIMPPHDLGRARVGEVAFVSPVGDAASQTCKVKVKVPNSDGAWLAGMQVRADVARVPVAREADDLSPGARVARGPHPDSDTPGKSER